MALFLSIISVVMFVASIVKFVGRKKNNTSIVTPILLLVGSLALFVFSTEMSSRELDRVGKEELEQETSKREKNKETQIDISNKEDKEVPIKDEELDRKTEIEKMIKSRIDDGEYKKVKLDKITINDNLGTDIENDYIALVYLKFEVMNSEKTGNTMMRKYSDDLSATLANKGIEDIAEIAVFWEDEYNKRDLKYAYEYRGNGFFIIDIAGE